jgi:hypothetical protein
VKTEIVYLGRDNTIDLLLKADDVAVDLSSVTKITASFGSVLVSSTDSAAGAIKWSGAGFDTGEIRIDVGAETIPVKTKYSVPIVVYDAVNTNGVHWGEVPVQVKANQEAGA